MRLLNRAGAYRRLPSALSNYMKESSGLLKVDECVLHLFFIDDL
jgi:hypothetical protein